MGQKYDNGDSGLVVRTEINKLIPENSLEFDPDNVNLDDKETFYQAYAQVGAIVVDDPDNQYGLGAAFTVNITTNGAAITLPVAWKVINNEYANDVDDYQLTAGYNGVDWVYSLIKLT